MSSSSSPTVDGKPPVKKKVDLYGILKVQKSATEKQITAAYRKLALQYHPDRNQGSEEAAEKFKEISTAYAILSDPNKRRQYDLTGESPDLGGQGLDSIDLENLGGMGRFFGAMMGKLGIPIPTQIGPTTLMKAKEICSGGLSPSILMQPPGGSGGVGVQPLVYGQTVQGRIDRQEGAFFLLSVSESERDSGIILNCYSMNRSRFKLVVFESSGSVRYVQESALTLDKRHTTATHFFVPFSTTTLREGLPAFEQEVPPVFTRLSTLSIDDDRSLDPGHHLVCVYGDNFLQRTQYALTVTLADLSEQAVERVKEMDAKVIRKKDELEVLQEEFTDLKDKYEALIKRIEEETKETHVLIQERESAYHAFIKASSDKQRREAPSPPPTSPPFPDGNDVEGRGGRPPSSAGGSSTPLHSFFSGVSDLLGGGSRK